MRPRSPTAGWEPRTWGTGEGHLQYPSACGAAWDFAGHACAAAGSGLGWQVATGAGWPRVFAPLEAGHGDRAPAVAFSSLAGAAVCNPSGPARRHQGRCAVQCWRRSYSPPPPRWPRLPLASTSTHLPPFHSVLFWDAHTTVQLRPHASPHLPAGTVYPPRPRGRLRKGEARGAEPPQDQGRGIACQQVDWQTVDKDVGCTVGGYTLLVR